MVKPATSITPTLPFPEAIIPAGEKIFCRECQKETVVPAGGYPADKKRYQVYGGGTEPCLVPTIPCPHCQNKAWEGWVAPIPPSIWDYLPTALVVTAGVCLAALAAIFMFAPNFFGR